jgi:L-ascorbate metabolism protein UlaG (beta-lactamase superfamily)
MMKRSALVLLLTLAVTAAAPAAYAQTVKITPLGSHDGEFCARDRALIFEDPDGTRILYDAGNTVRGPDDPRLGKIDVVLLSHVHGDHLGDAIATVPNSGECGKPDFPVKVTPKSNTVAIAVAKKAKVIVGSDMANFLAKKIAAAGGEASQAILARFGASRKVGGVTFATVLALHTNAVGADFLEGEMAKELAANGAGLDLGPATGYILQFSNGLVAYLSGDTGMTTDQKTVVHDYYKPKLVVMNIGDVFTTGPKEAAWVVNELIQPTSVIASHNNEAGTNGGKPIPGSKTEAFIKASKIPVHLPLSGKTMEFDATGKCVGGCS